MTNISIQFSHVLTGFSAWRLCWSCCTCWILQSRWT